MASQEEELRWRHSARRSNAKLVTMVVVLLGWAFLVTWYEPWTMLRVAGLGVFIVAAALVLISRLQLGSSFTGAAEARQLVTKGIYSCIQNPIYLFATIALAGLVLFLNRPWYFLWLLVVIPVQMVRIKRERRVLTEKFAETYVQYRKRTWF